MQALRMRLRKPLYNLPLTLLGMLEDNAFYVPANGNILGRVRFEMR